MDDFSMRMRYASLYHTWRNERYFYFIPELEMKKIPDVDRFTVQLYTQLVLNNEDGKNPLNNKC